MDKCNNYYSIDISKDVFDVMDDKGNHKQYPHNFMYVLQVFHRITRYSSNIQ